jgi:hypothetical protein
MKDSEIKLNRIIGYYEKKIADLATPCCVRKLHTSSPASAAAQQAHATATSFACVFFLGLEAPKAPTTNTREFGSPPPHHHLSLATESKQSNKQPSNRTHGFLLDAARARPGD